MLGTAQEGQPNQTWRIREESYLRIQGTEHHVKATCLATPPKYQVEWIQITHPRKSISV